MELTDKQAISILSTALLRLMDTASKERIDSCEAIGLIHSTVSNENGAVNSWLIKFDPSTCAFDIAPIETDKYPDGTFLYYHENDEEVVTQAALFGDGVTDDSD